ncbi:hypothetical protein BOTU111921_13550 [Bordetella tumbae]
MIPSPDALIAKRALKVTQLIFTYRPHEVSLNKTNPIFHR